MTVLVLDPPPSRAPSMALLGEVLAALGRFGRAATAMELAGLISDATDAPMAELTPQVAAILHDQSRHGSRAVGGPVFLRQGERFSLSAQFRTFARAEGCGGLLIDDFSPAPV